MAKLDDIVASFTLAGVLDETTATRQKFPVMELPLEDIADHPANATYSMDMSAIERLAKSIKRDGISDLPLVRRLPDGSFQMISGHRRKAAYAMLAKEDAAFAKLPCRIIDGIDDAKALALLHSANYFTRELTALERAAATKALEPEVTELRQKNPELKGVRTSDIKASLLKAQTGRDITGRTVAHHENIARVIENKLSPKWKDLARSGEVSDYKVMQLAKMSFDEQDAQFSENSKITKKKSSKSLDEALNILDEFEAIISTCKFSDIEKEAIKSKAKCILKKI